MNYWAPQPLFAGRTVFVLGGGPSLSANDARRLDPADVIAVNTAGEMVPDAAVLFWRDASWAMANREMVEGWRGMRVTTRHPRGWAVSLRVVAMQRGVGFPVTGVRWGPSSGHVAVALAVAMGAVRIVLLGFDGRLIDGRSHWHDRYRTVAMPGLYARFNEAWNGWRTDARKRGLEIVNATPRSAIEEFPIVSLDDVLGVRALAA